jgi:hypothetical protein
LQHLEYICPKQLTLQGKAQKTIEAYSRAIRRITDHFDCCPDQLKQEQLESYFAELVGEMIFLFFLPIK